jgi:hypothetical protein
MPKLPLLALALLSLVGSTPVASAPTSRPATTQAAIYEYRPATRDGIGKFYMGREIAHFMSHLGADWLERPEREAEEKPQLIMDNMGPAADRRRRGHRRGHGVRLRSASRQGAAGEGAGGGHPARRCSTGSRRRRRSEAIANVEPVLGTTSDPKLPKEGVGPGLMVDAYHEFDQPREMMEGSSPR